MKICHLETLMRESPRSPALLAQFISKENAHNSYPGVFKRRLRGDKRRGRANQIPPAACCCCFFRRLQWWATVTGFFLFFYFSYCATCLWSEESRQKLQWSERSEFGVQWASRATIESMEATRRRIAPHSKPNTAGAIMSSSIMSSPSKSSSLFTRRMLWPK